MIVDLQLENTQLVNMIDAQQAQYLSTFEENQELRDQLALRMIDEAPEDVPREFIDQECDVYAFHETAVVIQETADFIELAYVEMDAVQHLLICAQMHDAYLLDIFNWSNDVMRLMEFALSDLNPDWKDDPLEWTDIPPGYPGIYEEPSS